MSLRITAIILLFKALVVNAGDQPGLVRGRVYDNHTGEPLPNASVVFDSGRGTTSGIDGYYHLRVDTGHINLTFRFIGFRTVTRAVFVAPGDTVDIDIGLEQDVGEINQVVVSAGKVEQRISELTVSMNVIKPEAIASSHITDAADLVNKNPGIEVMDGQASIRGGSGYSYGAGSRVLALIDGLPVLSADAGNIKWQFLPLENISQIEIIKGASSVLYGSSALNGVINFRTSSAGSRPATRMYIETGIFDRPPRREWLWWDSPRMFYSTSLSHLQRSGNTDVGLAIHLLSNEGYRRLNDENLGRVSVTLKHDDTRVKGLSYGTSINAGLTRKRDFILWEDARSGALKQDESTAIRLNGNLVTVDPYITLTGKGQNRHDLRTRIQVSDNTYAEAPQNDSRALSFLSEYQYRHDFSPVLAVNAGIFENFSRISSAFYGDHSSMNLAGYTQADITPADRLKLIAGLRVEYNILNGSVDRLVPLFRAGLNYRLLDYTFLRASYGQGYRYPSIAERHASTTLGSVRIVPNPAILPESGWSSEIGVKQGIMTGIINGQIDLALFYTRNSDMIEYIFGIYPVPGEGVSSFGFMASNVEQSRVYGAEVEFALHGLSGGFDNSISGGYTFMYPVEFDPQTGKNTDVYLKYRRKHSFKLNISTGYQDFDLGLSMRANSRLLNIDDVFLSPITRETILPGFHDYWLESNTGYIVFDPYTGYVINEIFRISVVVNNVFNTEYMGRPGDIMPHRNFSLRLTGSF
jgi:outer membrane cobalamin receptor